MMNNAFVGNTDIFHNEIVNAFLSFLIFNVRARVSALSSCVRWIFPFPRKGSSKIIMLDHGENWRTTRCLDTLDTFDIKIKISGSECVETTRSNLLAQSAWKA